MSKKWQWCGQCGYKRFEGGPCPHCAVFKVSAAAYMGRPSETADKDAIKAWLAKYKPQIDNRED